MRRIGPLTKEPDPLGKDGTACTPDTAADGSNAHPHREAIHEIAAITAGRR